MRGRRLLRNRDYTLFWSGQALSELGSQTSAVAYPLLILVLTGSAAKAGVVGLAKWLPVTIFALPAGALADRIDRKRLMIGSDAIRMLGAASIVIALWLGQPSPGSVRSRSASHSSALDPQQRSSSSPLGAWGSRSPQAWLPRCGLGLPSRWLRAQRDASITRALRPHAAHPRIASTILGSTGAS